MNEQEILEGNKLIAEIMGIDIYYSDTVYKDSKSEIRHLVDNREKSDGLLFHCSWDWLMPVVLKILKEQNGENAFVFNWAATDWFCSIYSNKGQPYNNTDNNPILAVWNSVVQYLKNK